MGSLVRRGVGSWRWCSIRNPNLPRPLLGKEGRMRKGGENEFLSPDEPMRGFVGIFFR